MLSIHRLKGIVAANYYEVLREDDYYTRSEKQDAEWFFGESFGLSGDVKQQEFTFILSGFDKSGRKKLVKSAGAKDRRVGYDLTFSLPKSVSIMHVLGDKKVKKIIDQAHDEAIKKVLKNYVFPNIKSRTGAKGHGEKVGDLEFAVASFRHNTNRNLGPHYHSHVVLANVGMDKSGRTRSIISDSIYDLKMSTGALYRAEVAHVLERDLNINIVKAPKGDFAVEFVPKDVVRALSSRRQEIEAELEKFGRFDAITSQIATLRTRAEKKNLNREKIKEHFDKLFKTLGFTRDIFLKELEIDQKKYVPRHDIDLQDLFEKSFKKIAKKQSTFTKRDVVKEMAFEAQGKGVGMDGILHTIQRRLKRDPELVLLNDKRTVNKASLIRESMGKKRKKSPPKIFIEDELYTTLTTLKLERDLLYKVKEMSKRKGLPVYQKQYDKAVNKRLTMTNEQKKALGYIVDPRSQFRFVDGIAGAGKSYVFGAAKEIWEESGHKVIGAGLSANIARGFESGTGIKSQTLASLIRDIKNGTVYLNSKTVIVIDEIGMVDTNTLRQLVNMTYRSGVKIAGAGANDQLQPIDLGGAIKRIKKDLGSAVLNDIWRQEKEASKEVIRDLRAGKAKEALNKIIDQGRLFIGKTQEHAEDQLIHQWAESGAVKNPEDHFILVGTHAETRRLNDKAQLERLTRGFLGENVVKHDEGLIYEGDRIVFKENNRELDIDNGMFGVVKRIDEKTRKISVKIIGLKDNNEREIDLNEYEKVKLGYVDTTHSQQGASIPYTYTLIGSMLHREMAYVQESRHIKRNLWFGAKNYVEDVDALIARRMAFSKRKHMAVDYIDQAKSNLEYEKSFREKLTKYRASKKREDEKIMNYLLTQSNTMFYEKEREKQRKLELKLGIKGRGRSR